MSLVEEYMNPKMITVASKVSILEISKAMTDWKISSVAITDEQNKRIIGILTERDIVHGIADGLHPETIIANSLMSTPVLSIKNNQPIEEAARLMIKKRVRHLVVEDSSHVARGIITTTDLARYLKQKIHEEDPSKAQNESSDLMSEVWELFF